MAMKAVVFSEYGDPDVLRMGDVEIPEPGPEQVRIRVRAAGVNPFDWKLRSGVMREFVPLELPAVDGQEAAGVIDAVGVGVAGAAAGDAVLGFTVGGAAADYAILDDWAVKPEELLWELAAGLPAVVETSVRAFRELGGVRAGHTLLINGAAGGVGTAAVQLAVARGARVIGTASRRNHDYLRSLGAEPVAYGEDLVEQVRALTADGVDLAFDTAGRGTLPDLIALAGDPGRVVTIVVSDPAAAELGVIVARDAPRAVEALDEALGLIAAGRFQMPIARTFPFSEAAEAHRISHAGHVRGKLILMPELPPGG
jgi:NADPH:quinone reductase-like Zn-dependent oxidoreductase